ncbi:unnamed protein product [Staurois parvus]|uniref:Uncharacterized protein n=1 Tax=Staurois parvus TaxID=386267 RepID=A0ABN9EZP4_9NEOB|nr:unnamed protein product [Staurois parvus]
MWLHPIVLLCVLLGSKLLLDVCVYLYWLGRGCLQQPSLLMGLSVGVSLLYISCICVQIKLVYLLVYFKTGVV